MPCLLFISPHVGTLKNVCSQDHNTCSKSVFVLRASELRPLAMRSFVLGVRVKDRLCMTIMKRQFQKVAGVVILVGAVCMSWDRNVWSLIRQLAPGGK